MLFSHSVKNLPYKFTKNDHVTTTPTSVCNANLVVTHALLGWSIVFFLQRNSYFPQMTFLSLKKTYFLDIIETLLLTNC